MHWGRVNHGGVIGGVLGAAAGLVLVFGVLEPHQVRRAVFRTVIVLVAVGAFLGNLAWAAVFGRR